jgi:hypothetical protein
MTREEAGVKCCNFMAQAWLTQGQLAQILGISNSWIVHEWMHNHNPLLQVSDETARKVIQLHRFSECFLPGYRDKRTGKLYGLPGVIRRPSSRLEGRTALDVLLEGRVAEIAAHHETISHFQ